MEYVRQTARTHQQGFMGVSSMWKMPMLSSSSQHSSEDYQVGHGPQNPDLVEQCYPVFFCLFFFSVSAQLLTSVQLVYNTNLCLLLSFSAIAPSSQWIHNSHYLGRVLEYGMIEETRWNENTIKKKSEAFAKIENIWTYKCNVSITLPHRINIKIFHWGFFVVVVRNT